MTLKSFAIDVESCSGCGLCVVACKDEHVGSSYAPWTESQPAVGHFWMRLESQETGSIPRVSVSHLPIMCQHCTNAPCIPACSEGAIKRRDDGLVWIDPELCNGCGDCQVACPYDAIYINEESCSAQKCTGCAHRVDDGLDPRCVDICPHEAITFGDIDEPALSDDALEVFHPEFNAQPLVKWKGLPKRNVSGIVIDTGAAEVVPFATVTIDDLNFGDVIVTSTDEFGDFKVRTLVEGRSYRITIRKDGFTDARLVLGPSSDENVGEIELLPESAT